MSHIISRIYIYNKFVLDHHGHRQSLPIWEKYCLKLWVIKAITWTICKRIENGSENEKKKSQEYFNYFCYKICPYVSARVNVHRKKEINKSRLRATCTIPQVRNFFPNIEAIAWLKNKITYSVTWQGVR